LRGGTLNSNNGGRGTLQHLRFSGEACTTAESQEKSTGISCGKGPGEGTSEQGAHQKIGASVLEKEKNRLQPLAAALTSSGFTAGGNGRHSPLSGRGRKAGAWVGNQRLGADGEGSGWVGGKGRFFHPGKGGERGVPGLTKALVMGERHLGFEEIGRRVSGSHIHKTEVHEGEKTTE